MYKHTYTHTESRLMAYKKIDGPSGNNNMAIKLPFTFHWLIFIYFVFYI
jgi:hypothetical protein